MWIYLLKRFLLMIPTLIGITIITFFIIHLAPGDPVQAKMGQARFGGEGGGQETAIPVEQIELMRESFHLDKKWFLNYDVLFDHDAEIERHLRLLAAPAPHTWVDELRSDAVEESEEGVLAPVLREMREVPPLERSGVLDERSEAIDAFATTLRANHPLTVVWGSVSPDEAPDHLVLPVLGDLEERIHTLLLGLADASPDDEERRAELFTTFANRIRYDVALERAQAEVRLDRLERWSVPALIDELDGPAVRRDIALRILPRMVRQPFQTTYAPDASLAEREEAVRVWEAWWEGVHERTETDPEAAEVLAPVLELVAEKGSLASSEDWAPVDEVGLEGAAHLMEVLRDEERSVEERHAASLALSRIVRRPHPYRWEEGLTEEAKEARVGTWSLYWELHGEEYDYGFLYGTWLFFTDTQYALYMWDLCNLDFGTSFIDRRPVSEVIYEAFKVSVWLMVANIIVIYLVSIPIGILSAVWRGSLTDKTIGVWLFMLYSLPVIFIAPLLQLVLGTPTFTGLKLFPVAGLESQNPAGWLTWVVPAGWIAVACLLAVIGWLALRGKSPVIFVVTAVAALLTVVYAVMAPAWAHYGVGLFLLVVAFAAAIIVPSALMDRAGLGIVGLLALIVAGLGPVWLSGDTVWHGILPVACLSYAGFAGLSRYMRTGMLEILNNDYVRTARAKGLPERVVILKHALRNSLIPIITLLAGLLPALVGGSVIVETIFSIPGMGKLSIDAIFRRDYPVIMGIQVIVAVLVMLGILFSDILYAVVDPRISYE